MTDDNVEAILITSETTEWPVEAIKPNRYRVNVISIDGDCSHLGRLWIKDQSDVRIIGKNNAIVESFIWTRCDKMLIKNIKITKGSQLSNSPNSSVFNCIFSSQSSQPLRIRYGSNNVHVDQCLFSRTSPVPDHDIVAIQLSDRENLNVGITNCSIFNYSDGIQTTWRSGDVSGLSAGLLIEGCVIGLDKNIRHALGSENALDFKSGGTPDNPIIVRNCYLFGSRQTAENSGYSITNHVRSQYVLIEDTTISDSHGGIFVPEMRDDDKKPLPSHVYLRRVNFIDIHKSTAPDPKRTGYAMAGPNAVTFENVRYITCDNRWERLEELIRGLTDMEMTND